jgi:hypothetical protein
LRGACRRAVLLRAHVVAREARAPVAFAEEWDVSVVGE